MSRHYPRGEADRWRVRQSLDHCTPGAVLSGWMDQITAVRRAKRVGGFVEEYPLEKIRKRQARAVTRAAKRSGK